MRRKLVVPRSGMLCAALGVWCFLAAVRAADVREVATVCPVVQFGGATGVVIQAFSTSGALVFTEITNALSYRVDGAAPPCETWQTNLPGLTNLPAGGTGVVSVTVPMAHTAMCYRVAARVAIATVEPQIPTTCPALGTQCPAIMTQCPTIMTQCPMTPTQCLAPATQCPMEVTICGPGLSACPALLTQCPMAASSQPLHR
jgi:hypothetical protein